MKTCPYCEAEIANNAKKCKYCGEIIPREIDGNVKYDEEKLKKQRRKDKIENFIDKHFGLGVLIIFLIIAIVVGFFIPKEYTLRVPVIILIIGFSIAFYEPGDYKFYDDFFVKIFGTIFSTLIIYLLMIGLSYVFALLLYKIGGMGPMTYSHIICDKVTGTFKNCYIKGNVSFETGEKIYHQRGCINYGKTVIDRDYGESFFPNKDVAEKAGFRKCMDDYYDCDDYEPGYDYIDDYDSFMPRGY